MGLQRRMNMMKQRQVMSCVKAFALLQQAITDQQRLNLLMSGFRQLDLTLLFINKVIAFLLFRLGSESWHQFIDGRIQLGGIG